MPIRIQPNRPYYPRLRFPPLPRPGTAGGGGRRGAIGPGGIDTSSTGNVGGDIVKAIGNQIQLNRQNAAANAILNTQTPPRAAWVGGTAPAPGVSTAGTPPQTGGTGELAMRQQQTTADLNNALQQAKIKAALALAQQRTGRGGGATGGDGTGGNAKRWKDYLGGGGDGGGARKKAGKPAPYDIGSDANTNLDADKFPNVQADFDAKYGKGAYAKVAPNLANATVDDKGNYNITDSKGNPIMTLPADQANYWLARYNAASVRSGQQPIFTDKFPSANPGSGQPAGSQVNPYKPRNMLEARSLPNGSYLIHPDTGEVGLKGAAPTAEKTGQADTGKTADTGKVADTSDSDQALKDEDLQDQEADTGDQASNAGAQRPVQVASNSSLASGASTPPLVQAPADLAIGVGQDQTGQAPDTGSQSLADAIARARAQNQLQGVA